MSNEFWQYAVGGLGVTIIGALGAFVKSWFSRSESIDKLQYDQLKFLLEQSRADVIALKEENEKLRHEVHKYSLKIVDLTAEVRDLKEKLEGD